jgi:hypothetical protein
MNLTQAPSGLTDEYLVLLRQLASAQRRSSALARAHAEERARWQAALAQRDALIATLWKRPR